MKLYVTTATRAALTASLLAAVGLFGLQASATDTNYNAQDGTLRRVQVLGSSTVNLFHTTLTKPWEGKYTQTDTNPLYPNGCGAVAGRNLLSWYGSDPAGTGVWRIFEAEMGINKAAQGIDAPLGCVGLCAKFVGIPGCSATCLGLIMDAGNKGARQSGFVNAMRRWAPPGTKMFFQAHRNSLDVLLDPLSEGNPPVAIITTSPHVNHFVVVTGVYFENGLVKLRLANNGALDWPTFQVKWSRVQFGSNLERSVMDEVVGEKPYFVAWFSNATNRALGKFCTAPSECRSGLCDPRPGAGCVPNRTGVVGDFCTDHAQCTTRICSVPPGSVAGKCVLPASLPLGHACNAHDACATRRCDNRPGAGCVNQDGLGKRGEFCTTHQQCAARVCSLTTAIAGKCL